MKRVISLFSNKYFLSASIFTAWMLFFDRNDLMSQYDYRTELTKLQEEKDFYTKETELVKKTLSELTTDQTKLEKFAREKYLMKKDNEDIYVIIPEIDKEKQAK